MKANVLVSTLLTTLALCVCSSSAEPSKTLRVWKTYDDTFDLLLTAVFKLDGVNLKASFNHRNGKTYFVSEGDNIGHFVVEELSRTGRYDSKALLRHIATKETFELHIDRPLKVPGYRVQLADLTISRIWDLREADDIPAHGLTLRSITSTNVTASSSSQVVSIPPITEDERAALQTAWAQARQKRHTEAEAQRVATAKKKQEEAAAFAAARAAMAQRAQERLNVEIKGAPKFFFGTEYRYPSEYEYFYTFEPGPAGTIGTPRAIAIPTAFETRRSGWSMNVQP